MRSPQSAAKYISLLQGAASSKRLGNTGFDTSVYNVAKSVLLK